jgi:hypothetical protein
MAFTDWSVGVTNGAAAVLLTATTALVTRVVSARYDDRNERRKAHLAYISTNAVLPAVQSLQEGRGNDVGSFIRSLEHHGRLTYDLRHIFPGIENNAWRWLTGHDVKVADLCHALDAARTATVEEYKTRAAQLGPALLDGTGLHDFTEESRIVQTGEARAALLANLLLRTKAPSSSMKVRDVLEFASFQPVGTAIQLYWENLIVAQGDQDDMDRLAANIRNAYASPNTVAAIDAIEHKFHATQQARASLIQHLEVIAAEGGPRGRCAACPRLTLWPSPSTP